MSANNRFLDNRSFASTHRNKRLENIEGNITNGRSREIGTIGYTRLTNKTKHKHNTACVGHHYMQTNTNDVNKTWVLLQTTVEFW